MLLINLAGEKRSVFQLGMNKIVENGVKSQFDTTVKLDVATQREYNAMRPHEPNSHRGKKKILQGIVCLKLIWASRRKIILLL